MTPHEMELIKDSVCNGSITKQDVYKLIDELVSQQAKIQVLEKELSHYRCIPRLGESYIQGNYGT